MPFTNCCSFTLNVSFWFFSCNVFVWALCFRIQRTSNVALAWRSLGLPVDSWQRAKLLRSKVRRKFKKLPKKYIVFFVIFPISLCFACFPRFPPRNAALKRLTVMCPKGSGGMLFPCASLRLCLKMENKNKESSVLLWLFWLDSSTWLEN